MKQLQLQGKKNSHDIILELIQSLDRKSSICRGIHQKARRPHYLEEFSGEEFHALEIIVGVCWKFKKN
jgi:hypothetical protein